MFAVSFYSILEKHMVLISIYASKNYVKKEIVCFIWTMKV